MTDEVLGDSVYNKILSVNENLLTINNSWTSNLYYLPDLKHQFLLFPNAEYSGLLKRGSHKILASTIPKNRNFTYASYFTNAVSELLYTNSSNSANIIFCFKDIRDLINETSVTSIVNVNYDYILQKGQVSLENLKKFGFSVGVTENYFFIESENVDNLKNFLGKK